MKRTNWIIYFILAVFGWFILFETYTKTSGIALTFKTYLLMFIGGLFLQISMLFREDDD